MAKNCILHDEGRELAKNNSPDNTKRYIIRKSSFLERMEIYRKFQSFF